MYFYEKRVILYGTGEIARKFIEEFGDICDIRFCLDRTRMQGGFCGVTIKTWDAVSGAGADCVVIAAAEKNVRTIYQRIRYSCDYYDLPVYDIRGHLLTDIYRYDFEDRGIRHFCRDCSMASFKKEIDIHEAVSFDLFDTLIMRKVMEPVDVFDMIAARLDMELGQTNFKVIRHEAERKVNGVEEGLEPIYEEIGRRTGVTKELLDELIREEFACEKEVLIPRGEMLELFRYAVSQGKKVNLITDMYLPQSMIEELLCALDIKGYDKIYLSCEYGSSKRNGLFAIYKQEIDCDSCLHIGDNRLLDGACQKEGIDFLFVPSALELFCNTPFRRMLKYANTCMERRLIGETAAILFNSPFAMCRAEGIVKVDSLAKLGKCFITPIVFSYMSALKKKIGDSRYDKVLLSARDGYLFDRIIRETSYCEERERFIYFIISRELAYKLGMGTKEVDEDYRRYLEVDDRRAIAKDSEASSEPYAVEKRAFHQYMVRNGLKGRQKVLFCDLISGGTVQNAIQHMFEPRLDGFYMGRTYMYTDRKIHVECVYERDEILHDQLLIDRLETFLCSQCPSVKGMNADGEFLYGEEHRGRQELEILQKLQDFVIESFREYVSWQKLYKDELDKMLSHTIFALLDEVDLEGETAEIKKWSHLDNNGEVVRLF